MKTIVLPEAQDKRIIEAAAIALKEEYAKIILLGNQATICQMAQENDFDISKATIIDPQLSEKRKEYAESLYELRKAKGMTLEQAQELILDEVYFGMMMIKKEEADGLVSRSNSFYFRYFTPSTTNFENSTWHQACFCFFCDGCTRL